MRNEGPGEAVAWMAAGAAMLLAGALFGSATGRRERHLSRPDGNRSEPPPDSLAELADRPVAQAALAEGVTAARRLDRLAGSLQSLEARVNVMERGSSAEVIEAVGLRVLQLEERIEQIQAQRAEPPIDAIVAEAETRLSPQIHRLEARIQEHHSAIQQLQAHTVQTDANLQKMIAAVEKLAEQIARVLPPASGRAEPRRESAAAAAQGGTQADPEAAEPRRWKALAL